MSKFFQTSSIWDDAILRLKSNRLALFGSTFIILLVILAIFTPLISPYDYAEQNRALGAIPPNAQHLLGTDYLGRDLLTRMLYGSRISLLVGFIATMVALTIGVTWGTVAGYIGGSVDTWMMRIVDTLYGIPFITITEMVTYMDNIKFNPQHGPPPRGSFVLDVVRLPLLIDDTHHHFELSGWHENQVVVRFWIIGILLALLSLTTFKIQ